MIEEAGNQTPSIVNMINKQHTTPAFVCSIQYEWCCIIFLLKEYNLSYHPFKGVRGGQLGQI